jgi:hypothetical protein
LAFDERFRIEKIAHIESFADSGRKPRTFDAYDGEWAQIERSGVDGIHPLSGNAIWDFIIVVRYRA